VCGVACAQKTCKQAEVGNACSGVVQVGAAGSVRATETTQRENAGVESPREKVRTKSPRDPGEKQVSRCEAGPAVQESAEGPQEIRRVCPGENRSGRGKPVRLLL